MQQIANDMKCTLYWTKYTLVDDKTLILIYKKNFLG